MFLKSFVVPLAFMRLARQLSLSAVSVVCVVIVAAAAQPTQDQFQPQVGQPGKDVVWVPTPPELVEKMLDMARVTPNDFVVDLGSGDGRNVIAAAKRGARGLGVEFNPDMVELSKRAAAKEGVADKATFVQGDMFEAEFPQATVLALFLLPDNMLKLRDKFLELKPGTRIVGNTFGIEGWEPDEQDSVGGDCATWCTSLLWIVPAKVAGTWVLPTGDLILKQAFQKISGTISSDGAVAPIANGRLRGDQISFTARGAEYSGRISSDAMSGTLSIGGQTAKWQATRARR